MGVCCAVEFELSLAGHTQRSPGHAAILGTGEDGNAEGPCPSGTAGQGGTTNPIHPASVIPEGRRRDTLWRLGRRLRLKGWSPESIAKKMLKVNAEQCRPPLDGAEVELTIQHLLSHPDRARYQR